MYPRHFRYKNSPLWVIIAAMVSSACGTMPIPSVSLPPSVVAESSVVPSPSGGKTEQKPPRNPAPIASAEPALPGENPPPNEATSTTDVAVVGSEAVDNVPDENTQSKDAGETNPARAAELTTAMRESPPVEDILHRPVISKSQTSQAVYAPLSQQSENSGGQTAGVVAAAGAIKTAGASGNQPIAIIQPQRTGQDVPEFAVLTANERVQNAIVLLNDGATDLAEKQLADALVIEPNNRAARKLMRQLHESPEDFFAMEEYFEYALGSNETLLNVAEKFLDDPLEFYMLAKLNNIQYPNSLVSGKTLKIPGQNPEPQEDGALGSPLESLDIQPTSPTAVQNENDVETLQIERAKVYYVEHRYQEAIALLKPYANKQPASQYAQLRELLAHCYVDLINSLIKKGDLLEAQATLESSVAALPENKSLKIELAKVRDIREAERLYRLGLEESQTGNETQAIKTLAKALQLNPEHEQANKQIADLRLTVVEESHKKAMVLYRKQELSRAIEIWDDIIELDPGFELAKQYRTKALELKRKIEQL